MKITIEITPEEFKELESNGIDLKSILMVKDESNDLSPLFNEWVKNEFGSGISTEWKKSEALSSLQIFHTSFRNFTSNHFKNILKIWCKKNDYEFEDRIMKSVVYDDSGRYRTEEFIRVTKK